MKFLNLMIFFTLICPFGFSQRTQVYTGIASNEKKLCYTEKHLVFFDGEDHVSKAETSYFDARGKLISFLTSDFKKSLTAPDHVIKDERDGSSQGLRSSSEYLELFYQEKSRPETNRLLPKNFSGTRVVLGCQGLNYYLVQNLDTVKLKKNIPISFLIPGNLESYHFEIKYLRELDHGIVELDIEIENWFLKLFAPKLHVKYDKIKQRIVWYQGLSNLKDEKGKTQAVTINYVYD